MGVNQDGCLVILQCYLVSGFRCQVSGRMLSKWASPDETIHHLPNTLPFPQLTAIGVFAPGLSSLMFSPIH
jgi:hypothetical protein